MAKRTYTQKRRGEAAEETRQRIVEATYALHAERGIAATSMKDIAARAGVSVGSVYHHFPTYEDAIGACGAYTRIIAPPPTEAIFDGATTPEARIERLAEAVFGWFEALPAFGRVRCDQHLVPSLRPFVDAEAENRIALTRAALAGTGASETAVLTAAALLDHAVYQSLVRSGFSREAAAAQVAGVLRAWLLPTTGGA